MFIGKRILAAHTVFVCHTNAGLVLCVCKRCYRGSADDEGQQKDSEFRIDVQYLLILAVITLLILSSYCRFEDQTDFGD